MALVAVLSLFFARSALAQLPPASGGASISVVNETTLVRLDASGNQVQKRPITLNPEGVNLQDCIDNQSIQFTLQLAGFVAQSSVQAWANSNGADCSAATTRSGGLQVCWPLTAGIPLQTSTQVNIPVRTIMSGALPNSALKPDATENVCGAVDLTQISVQFLYFNPGQPGDAAASHTSTITVDTVGPDPPSGLTVLPGNTRITVQWTSISGAPVVDSGTGTDTSGTGLVSLTGVQVYCDPAAVTVTPGTSPVCTTVANEGGTVTPAPIADASTDADAEVTDAAAPTTNNDAGVSVVCTDGGAATANACSSPNFVSTDGGKLFATADFTAKFGCGSIFGNSGTTVVADKINGQPLTNGTNYAVAVAATDGYGNVGPLSAVVCEVPADTTDFWSDYKNAGGKGGGCATGGEEAPLSTIAFAGLIAALAVSSARRRWRNR